MNMQRDSGDPVTPKRERPKCGARTRAGGRCKAPATWDYERDRPRSGRCRMHGGLATGPRTPEGLQRTLTALWAGRDAYWRKRREERENNG